MTTALIVVDGWTFFLNLFSVFLITRSLPSPSPSKVAPYLLNVNHRLLNEIEWNPMTQSQMQIMTETSSRDGFFFKETNGVCLLFFLHLLIECLITNRTTTLNLDYNLDYNFKLGLQLGLQLGQLRARLHILQTLFHRNSWESHKKCEMRIVY